ncbi:hypothetical protein RND81_10G096400 [Saponaria officinalis]|uniref:Uncharacterized protein n=1 Tax=Saponaria officinalis TaxID=3572 RepID=A0AAW1I114_SAPOF
MILTSSTTPFQFGYRTEFGIEFGVKSGELPDSSSYMGPHLGSSPSVDTGFVEFVSEPRQDEDTISIAKHLESANTMFFFIWWIIGFYWVSSGGEMFSDNAPNLYCMWRPKY